MKESLPAPPAGVHLATGGDKFREGIWITRSLLWERIFTRRSTTGQRLFSLGIALVPLAVIVGLWRVGEYHFGVFLLTAAVLVLTLVLTLALCVALIRWQQRGAQTHMYVLDDQTATLTMTANGDYWTIASHNRRRTAPGAGERLQDLLLPVAAAAADHADVGVRLIAAAPKLAARYAEKLPGLLEVGPAVPYGIRMYRPSITQRRTLAALVDDDD